MNAGRCQSICRRQVERTWISSGTLRGKRALRRKCSARGSQVGRTRISSGPHQDFKWAALGCQVERPRAKSGAGGGPWAGHVMDNRGICGALPEASLWCALRSRVKAPSGRGLRRALEPSWESLGSRLVHGIAERLGSADPPGLCSPRWRVEPPLGADVLGRVALRRTPGFLFCEKKNQEDFAG